ncbi:MAG: dTMP kinase [Methanospirillum sp.]|nr:dTMP kinase [Methanospirillum sp.]
MVLITIEGIDGSGKSTLVRRLRARLADIDPVFTREPTAGWTGKAVRRGIAREIDPVAEALLFAADHASHLETTIRPALRRGRTVISDRYSDSRYAYQSVVLDGRLPDPLEWLKSVHAGWTIPPDRTFLLVLPVDRAMERLERGGGRREHFEQADLLERIQGAYLELAGSEPDRFVLVDAMLEKGEILDLVERTIRQTVARSR